MRGKTVGKKRIRGAKFETSIIDEPEQVEAAIKMTRVVFTEAQRREVYSAFTEFVYHHRRAAQTDDNDKFDNLDGFDDHALTLKLRAVTFELDPTEKKHLITAIGDAQFFAEGHEIRTLERALTAVEQLGVG